MKNPNQLIQETYSSYFVQKSLSNINRLCQLNSLYINKQGEVSLCRHSKKLGQFKSGSVTDVFAHIKSYRKTLPQNDPGACECRNRFLNLSLLDENYLEQISPIRELTIYSDIDFSLLKKILKELSPYLKNLNLIATNTPGLIELIEKIPADLSLRIYLNDHVLSGELVDYLNRNTNFVMVECTKDLEFDFEDKNFVSLNFVITKDNYLTAYLDLNRLSQKNYLIKLDANVEDIDLAQYVHHLLNLEPRYDSYFLKMYEILEPVLNSSSNKKFKQLLRLKWLNISFKGNSFCHIPFTELAISADGSYQPCCWIFDYDLRDQETGNDIQKIWNGKPITELRNEFLSGNIRTCQSKIKEFACNQFRGPRTPLSSFSHFQTRPMFKFHWHFNGACNLKCQMCSTWQQDKEFAESEVYFDDLKKNVLPYISELELVGGEPFFQKRSFALIDFMKNTNPLCIWNITSNGQFSFKGKIEQALNGLRLGLFSVSIDSLVPETFSKIRINGELERTLDFLDKLINFRNLKPAGFKFDININFVIQKDNWSETEDLIVFAKQKGVNLYVSPLSNAPRFSIYNLGTEEKNHCYQYLKMLYNRYHHPNLLNLINNLGLETTNK